MSCVFRIGGNELDLDSLLTLLLEPEAIFRKGDKQGSRVILKNGANYLVSEAEFDQLDKQKSDAISYLRKNSAMLKKALSLPGVERAFLDFAVEEKDTFTQSAYLEPTLLKLAGGLGVGIKISIYPSSDNEQEWNR